MSKLTRGQIAYRGFSQLCAWLMTGVMWVAPVAYAVQGFRLIGFVEGGYLAIGSFVVLRSLRNWVQGEADGRESEIGRRAIATQGAGCEASGDDRRERVAP